jgi:adenosylcobinamide kinase / adenosylcobinamide-phosphate guanylyltransferase
MTGHTTLILGGARSGKSVWAEHLASQSGRPVLFVATATAGDAEMAERITRHRAQRPPDWRTLEEPVRLLNSIRASAQPGDVVLVDCLTLWVSNIIVETIGPEQEADSLPGETWRAIETSIVDEAHALAPAARDRGLTLMLISNEVGLGVVPATSLGRRYRDILGRVNQAVASVADSVVLMVAGLPVDVRKLTATLPPPGPDPDHR